LTPTQNNRKNIDDKMIRKKKPDAMQNEESSYRRYPRAVKRTSNSALDSFGATRENSEHEESILSDVKEATTFHDSSLNHFDIDKDGNHEEMHFMDNDYGDDYDSDEEKVSSYGKIIGCERPIDDRPPFMVRVDMK
jgi:hypothetical protein